MKTKIIRTQADFDELDRTKIINFNLEIEMSMLVFEGNLYAGGYIDAGGYSITMQGFKYIKIGSFRGLYKHIVMPLIKEDGSEFIRLGCFTRSVQDWATNFWNNPREFPNNGDMPSKLRWLAYQTCLRWLEINREGEE